MIWREKLSKLFWRKINILQNKIRIFKTNSTGFRLLILVHFVCLSVWIFSTLCGASARAAVNAERCFEQSASNSVVFFLWQWKHCAPHYEKKSWECEKAKSVVLSPNLSRSSTIRQQMEKTVRITITNSFDGWVCFCHWWQKSRYRQNLNFFLILEWKAIFYNLCPLEPFIWFWKLSKMFHYDLWEIIFYREFVKNP